MEFRRRQILGWSLLGGAVLLGGGWLLRLDYGRKISTDVLDLVPGQNVAPELALVRQLAGEAESRTVLCELTVAGRPAPAEAAQRFAEALRQDPAFDQAVTLGDTAARDALGQELFAQRFALLFPRWLRDHRALAGGDEPGADPAGRLAHAATAELGKFLTTPEALAFQDLLPADPLLLMPSAAARLKDGFALVQPPAEATPAALVWARLAASPMSEAGQGPAFAAMAKAEAATAAEFPGVTAAYTGVNRFAAASRARIEREVKWLNAASLVAVVGIAFAFIRQAWRGLHLVPVVALSTLGAWVCTTLVFARVHVLVFVFGSLLTGVAIDYGFYLFTQPPAGAGEEYAAKVRRLAKPLLASCLTTVAGFALLLFSELPFIRQLGVFVGAGLVCALAAAVVYFATVANPFLETREFRGAAGLAPAWRRGLRRGLVVLAIVALPGLARLQWRDDIRDLDIAAPKLKAEDARIRAKFGAGSSSTVYITYGTDLASARVALARFEAWLAGTAGGSTPTVSLGAVIPTPDEAAEAARFFKQHPEFPDKLRAALDQEGFESAGFAPFFADYARAAAQPGSADTSAAVAGLRAKLAGPLGLLIHDGKPLSWFVTLAGRAPAGAPPADTQTVTASQLQSLNQVFAQYRLSALWLSAIGLAIVGSGVLLTYGWRDGLRIFAIPAGACLGLFGLLGWIGQPLNLFHLLGAFLGVCLTHNYSIFSATSAYRREPPPVSVRLSALTAAASFGVLATSSIPVVRALGLTVSLMVLVALLVIEFEHLSGLGRKP
ncbi:MAG TPA: MMPL family transporter [Lacunisphaera sp.]|nr:MMPL family transporter [Lacunisphaera sp.]